MNDATFKPCHLGLSHLHGGAFLEGIFIHSIHRFHEWDEWRENREQTKGRNMQIPCLDPPEMRNPGLRPGFQYEPSLNSSDGNPQRDSFHTLVPDTPEVKATPHQVVDSKHKSTTNCMISGAPIAPDQQALLDRIHPHNRSYGILLALHGELLPEHCEDEKVHDDWSSEIERRVNKFL